jgi:peptidoglycan/LPS O-acetylase OafA/YrhL
VTAELPTVEIAGSRSSGLDGLRAAASIAVVLFHAQLVTGLSFGPLDPLVAGANTGIWVFFALSGYLLYRPFVTRPVDLRSYALKRASRILPGYYVALGALFVLVGSRLPLEHPVAYLTITSSYEGPLRDFLGPAWTLSAEVLFYLTLPLIARLAAGREVAVLVTLGAMSMVASVVQRYTATAANVYVVDTYPFVFFGFVPGMLLAVLEARRPALFKGLAKTRHLLAGLAFVALGMLTSVYPLPLGAVFGTPLVIGWLLHHRVPGTRALVFAGGASYALYLWHYDLLRAFGLAGVVIAVVGSALSWAVVERPILNWAHRRSTAWRAPKLRAENLRGAVKAAS